MSTYTNDDANQNSGAKEKAENAAGQAREVGEHAAQAGKSVSQSAASGAQQVAHDVRDQGVQLKNEATQQFHSVAQEATTQLREQAGTQADRAAQQLHQLADQARALVEGRREDAGMLPQLAEQATDKLTGIAQRVETGGIDGVLSDARSFARRRPGTFLLLAGVAGFTAGRVLRGAQAANELAPASSPSTPSALANPAGVASVDLAADGRVLTEARS